MEKELSLEEKYRIAIEALRNIVDRGREGTGPNYDDTSVEYYNGYDAGLMSVGDDAEHTLRALGEKNEK